MMSLQFSEKQLLFVLNNSHKINGGPNRANLEKFGQTCFKNPQLDWAEAYHSLHFNELIYEENENIRLTERGKKISQEVEKSFQRENYNQSHANLENSKAYGRYCERVYGKNLYQINMTDITELNFLMIHLNMNKDKVCLDLGCGSGMITEYISDVTGATITGIDFADQAVNRASARTQSKQDRLTFLADDFENISFPENSFDIIFAIDSLYSTKNIDKIISNSVKFLKLNGQFAIFYGNNGKKQVRLKPEETKLGQSLTKLGFNYEIFDYSNDLIKFWTRSKDVATKLKTEFISENQSDLYESLIRQADLNLANIAYSTHYLYCIQKPYYHTRSMKEYPYEQFQLLENRVSSRSCGIL